MKKSFILVGMLAIGFANAQTEEELQGRVGINTKTPKASLDISRHTNLPETRAQGVLFPKFSTADRDKFTNTEVGTMIYNTDKKCLEMYMGVVSGVHQWSCLPDAGSSQQQNISVTPVGFEGSFVQGVALTNANKAKFKIVNNSFAAVSNVDFSSAVTIQNGTANITATGVNANNVSLASGAERILEYTLGGTPENGTLTADFSRLGLTASQNTTVGMGRASFSSKTNDHYVVSLIYNSTVIQGKINNGANKLTVKIPYTSGAGSYNAYTNTRTTAAGQGNDTNPLTLSIPAGNFGVNGELTGTITVGGDGEYLVKQMAPGQEYTIATFPIDINGSTTTVVLKGIGGIPDRNFNVQTDGAYKHRFIYLPIEITGANGYKRTWLNNNLGAEYADANNPRGNFNPAQQAKAHNDHLAFGSLFQWQRPSDGHELITWTSATTGTFENTHQIALWDSTDWKPNHSKFILIGGMISLGDWENYSYSWVTKNVNANSAYHNLWQVNGANNPCPEGYHVPTSEELFNLRDALNLRANIDNWYNSSLRMTNSPYRQDNDGNLRIHEIQTNNYWTSTGTGERSTALYFHPTKHLHQSEEYRSDGLKIRCVEN